MNLLFVEEIYDEIFDGLEPKNVTTGVPTTVVTVNKNDLIQRLATLENENTELEIQLRSGICVSCFLSILSNFISREKLMYIKKLSKNFYS
jgi:hypothetical protein